MRSIKATTAIATVGAALTITGSAFAAAETAFPPGPTRQDRHDRVLRLTAETEQDAFVHVGAPGPTLGDQIVSADAIFRGDEPFGTDGVTCTIEKASPGSLTCNWIMTLALPGGQITLQGIADGPAGPPTEPLTFELAVTGGTGRYRNARGFAAVVDNPGGVEHIELHLK